MKAKNANNTKDYVIEHHDGTVHKENGVVKIVKAKSKEDALAKVDKDFRAIYRGEDWDVRRAGDEPRIEAIERYADYYYEIGRIEKEIKDLKIRRDAWVAESKQFREIAYQLPSEYGPFDDDDDPLSANSIGAEITKHQGRPVRQQ